MRNIHLVLGAPIRQSIQLNDYHVDDIVIGADRGALNVINAGYRLDLALGDFDSISADEWEKIKKSALKIRQFSSKKDKTDGELAMSTMSELIEPSDRVYIYHWLSSGRLDHLISILWWGYCEEYQSFIEQCTFISEKNRMKFLLPGVHTVDPDDNYDYVSIIQMTPVKHMSIRHFKYELEEQDVNRPYAWISNEFEGTQSGEISFSSGTVLLIYTKD